MNKEIRTNNIYDIILATFSTVVFFGIILSLYFILDLNFEENPFWEEEKEYLAPVIGFIILGYYLMLGSIKRWTMIIMNKLGAAKYNRKHIKKIPINEQDPAYKAIEADVFISETSRMIQEGKKLNEWEDVVWFHNQHERSIDYKKYARREVNKCKRRINILRSIPKFLLKNKSIKIEKLDEISIFHRDNISKSIDMIHYINQYDKDKVIEIDEELYDSYNIHPYEYDSQSLLDNEPSSFIEWIEKIRESKTFHAIMDAITLGVAIYVFILLRKYELDYGNISTDDKIFMGIVLIFFISKMPSKIASAIQRYILTSRAKLRRRHIFRKFVDKNIDKD